MLSLYLFILFIALWITRFIDHHLNGCVLVNFTGGLLLDETSRVAGLANEAMENLAPIFEGPVPKRTTKAPAFSLEMPHVMLP